MADTETEGKLQLGREQKIGFVLLLIFAIMAITLGVVQIRNTFYAPFALKDTVPSTYKSDVTGIDALRFRDTDGDGLSDFDELYIYGTSPYLYDTFGYGMSDKEVIARKLPLCPKGQDCVNPIISGQGAQNAVDVSTTFAVASAPSQPPDVLQMLHDPEQLRPLLVQAGMNKTLLDKISDADLMSMVNQLLQSTSTAGINLQNLSTALTASTTAK